MTINLTRTLVPLLSLWAAVTAQELPSGLKEVQRGNGITIYANELAIKAEAERRARVASRASDNTRWLHFYDEHDRITRIDRQSIQVDGLLVRAQFREDLYLPIPERPDIAYTIIFKEFDCAQGTSRGLWAKGYDDRDSLVFQEYQPRPPVAWVPGTLGEARYRTMCALRGDVGDRRDSAVQGR